MSLPPAETTGSQGRAWSFLIITGDTEHLATPELPVERMALVHVNTLLRTGMFVARSELVVWLIEFKRPS